LIAPVRAELADEAGMIGLADENQITIGLLSYKHGCFPPRVKKSHGL
jgi:hypothetical protein